MSALPVADLAEPSRKKLFSWASKGSAAIFENGLVSGSNFVISIFLARWLLLPQYGAFALAFSIALLLSLAHTSLVQEPMAVLGGAMPASSLRPYVKTLLVVHVGISAAVSIALGIAAFLAFRLHVAELPGALAGLSLAVPFLHLFNLTRRIFYVRTSPAPVVLGAILYFSLLVGGLLIFRSRMTPFMGFILMGAAALVSSAFLFWRLQFLLEESNEYFGLADIWRQHWDYGRWAIASSILGWIAAYACYPVMSLFRGISEVGDLKALMNFTAPVTQTLMALAGLILPYAAGCQGRGSSIAPNRITALFVTAGLAYWTVVMFTSNAAFHLLYGGKYQNVRALLPLFALESLIWSAGCEPKIVLRAMKLPNYVFYANLTGAVIFLVVGMAAVKPFGLVGVVSAITLADLVSGLMAFWFLRRNAPMQVTRTEVTVETSEGSQMDSPPFDAPIRSA